MAASIVLATLSGSAPNERLQVSLVEDRHGRIGIDLRQQHFAEGIGWYDQRGLSLDARQWRQLRQVIAGQGVAVVEEAEDNPGTIPFPGPRSQDVKPPSARGVFA